MAQMFYRKKLTAADVINKLAIAADCLDQFPRIPPGQHSRIFQVLDVECNCVWNFRLSVRMTGSYDKPTVGGQWIQFCKSRGIKKGHTIQFFKERDEATGNFRYMINLFYDFFNPE
ncbi:hypothetical protein Pint_19111 [Pistacia integerrima]|uniref:Uncharacterized protein n=1 Tax=Pistacia integerrima TaxID=434235 RepID=A0ACC0Z041_9ROSI|nr:hypothetical protein Pint_19111 [Pistacia integerrima]